MKVFNKEMSFRTALALCFTVSLIFGGALFADETTDDTNSTTSHTNASQHSEDVASHPADSHGAVGAEGAEGEGGESHEGGHEVPNLITIFFGHKAHPGVTDIQFWENVIFALFAGLILVLLARKAYTKRQLIPGRYQNAVEILVQYFYDFFYQVLGKETKRMMPFLGTLFFYILTMNLMGLVPGLKSSSTSINITASLAILVFLYSQYIGMKELGFVGWVDHLAGSPRDVTGWVLVPLMLPIHIIGEFAKPFSLAARLFGNITGEDIVIFALIGLGISLTGDYTFVGLPLQVLFIPFGILFSLIQALVFTILSTIYISLMLPHEEHH